MKFVAALGLVALVSLNLSTSTANQTQQNGRVLACYYGSWSVYRPGNGKFEVEDIDPNMCTHVLYGFAGLSLDGELKILDAWNDLEEDFGRGAMRRFTNLKQQNPSLVTLLAIGGWNDCEPLVGNTCEKYSIMASTRANRQKFIDSVIPFVERYNFDGFDLDWEYPTFRGGRPEDKVNFALLCEEMRAAFDERGLLLTAAVSAGEPTIVEAYDVPSISRSLHYIFLMAYDLHGGWEDFAHHQAPLGRLPQETDENFHLNVKHAVDVWLDLGCPADKLVLGMGAYGRGWNLVDEANSDFYAPTAGLIEAGPYTREAGIWGYNEVLEKQNTESGWRVVRDPDVVGPYAVNGRKWIGYDDVESIVARCEYLKQKGLGGGMFWSVETDDFKGLYSPETYPLIKAARRSLGDGVIPTPSTTTRDPTAPTTTSTTTTPRPTTTLVPGVCTVAGDIPHPSDCRKYITCYPVGDGEFGQMENTCNPGTIYDPQSKICNWCSAVNWQQLCAGQDYTCGTVLSAYF